VHEPRRLADYLRERRDAILGRWKQEVARLRREQVFARALRGERAASEVLVRHVKTGEDHTLRSAAAPILQSGRALGAVAINTDITERKRIEGELRAAVEFGERIRGVLGHDLRNPLGVIVASASLLQATQLGPQQQRAVARIQSAA
jgi:signal transduction histidine kinase